MKNGLFRICSMILVIVLLINMLPLQVIAQQLNSDRDEQIQTETIQPEDNIPEAKIVEEIPQKRTEYSKEYLLENGLHMINVYPEAVHYATENGWEEIDNTLIAKADGTISNTAGVWDVSFPQQLSKDKSISIKKDGYTLSFFMAGEITSGNMLMQLLEPAKAADAETVSVTSMKQSAATIQTQDLSAVQQIEKHEQKMLQKTQSRLIYTNVYQNTDVIYDLKSNKVKESIVMESYDSALRGYRYTLDVGTMVPVLEEDGQIIFYDSNREKVVFVMPAPYMIDDAGERNDEIRVQLTGSGSHYIMTYLLPQQWLAEKERAWPVILDPVVQPQLTTSNIRDRTVVNQGSFSQTWGMNACGLYSNGDITRTYLKYENLPHLTSSDVVVSATIHMYRPSNSTTVTPVFAHKVLGTWASETISWSNMPEYNQTIEDYAIVQAMGWYAWDITDVVRDWYTGNNTGVMFKTSDEIEDGEETNFKEFYSSDYGNNKPSLSIYFRNNNGLEDYWDYTSVSAGGAGTGYINNYTGNLIWIRGDFGFGGNRMPVSISHIYNANDAYKINDDNNSDDSAGNGFGMGNGWRTNYNQLVRQWSMDSRYYIWEDTDGTDHYFLLSSDGTYKDEDGLELTLTITGSNTELVYKITDKNGNASYFDYRGRLYKIENNQETKSSISIGYYGDTWEIDYITDGVGRKYNFEYENGLLYSIDYMGYGTEPTHSMTYDYEGSNLVCIYDNGGPFSEYTYGSRNLLISATDMLGYSLNYTYNNAADYQPSRVLSVEERQDESFVAGKLTFEYAHNQTVVTDHSQNTLLYQFNNFGNTVCVQDDEGHAQYYKYATDTSQGSTTRGNQLRAISKLQNTVSNLFWDGGFEYGTPWDSTGGASVSIVLSEAYYGNQALQIISTIPGTGACEYTYPIEPGETVTFSAYVKTGSTSATISIFDSFQHTKSELVESNSDWTRLEVTYTNTSFDVGEITPYILVETAGTCLVDCVQMEYSASANRYNLVEDSDFGHCASAWSSYEGLADSFPAAPQLQGLVYQMNGMPTAQNRITQGVPVNGTAGDNFVLAGWAKGNAAPLRQEGGYKREFAIQVEFHYTDGTMSAPFIAQFNPDSDRWQYAAAAAVAAKAYYYLTVSLIYDYNVNTAYFDGIQLYKEEFSTSYTYDNEGNVISATDYANQNAQYNYTGNNLDKLITPTGTGYEYVYDERNNLVLSRSSEGLQYEFAYDTYGNPLQATVGTNMYSASVTKGKTYYIRNRLSGKYMDLWGRDVVIQNPFSGAETQKWEVVQNTDGTLSLKNVSNADRSHLTIPHAGSANGTPVHIYAPNYTAQNEADRIFLLRTQGLRIQPAEKYTYKILTKSGDYATCVEVPNDNTSDVVQLVLWEYDGSEAQQWYFQPVDQEPSTEIEDGSVYQFRSLCSGRYAAVDNQSTTVGALMVQYRQEGLASQKFEVNRYGDTDYYTLTPQNAPDKLLQISSDVNSIFLHYMQLGDSTVTDSKLFRFEYYEPMQGFYIIPKTNEGIALEVLNSVFADGGQLVFTNKQPINNRMFIAEKVSDTIVSTATYSADGNQLLSTTDALGKVTTYGYDADTGLLEWVQYPEDTVATRTNYTYDGNGRLESVSADTDTGNNQFVYYSFAGENLSEILTTNNFYYIDRGDFGLTNEIWAGAYRLATYTYTDDRNKYLSEVDYGNGHSVQYTYDNKGRLIEEYYETSFEDYETTTYVYNNDGNLAAVTDSSASGVTDTKYYYDLIGRLAKRVDVCGIRSHSIQYTYDEINKLTSLEETINGISHTNSYAYDSVNRVSSVTNGTVSENYTYDSLSRVSQTVTKNGDTGILTESYTFTSPSANTTSGQIATNRLQAAGYDVTYSYTYDGNGNILSISDGTNTTSYVYDSANQLIRENNQSGGFTHTWTYDNCGNILTRKEYTYTTGMLGTLLNTVIYEYEEGDWGDRIVAYDGQEIDLDDIGNTYCDGTWEYRWRNGRELFYMNDHEQDWFFEYNADGMRTLRVNYEYIEYQYFYNGSSLTQMTVGDDVLYFAYGANGVPMSLTYNDVVYYYVTNIQGDVIAILDAAGNLVVSYSYDAWGNPISTTGSMADTLGVLNPLRYRGYVYDQETGLYYLQTRYYNPEWGRFISADAFVSTGQGILGNNMFAYCQNNPVVFKDVTGHFLCTAIGAFVGGAFGALSAAIEGKTGDEFKASVLAAATAGAISGLAADVLLVTGGTAGVVVGVMATAGAIGAVAGNAVHAEVTGTPIDWKQTATDAIWDGMSGALFGYMGGELSSNIGNMAKKGVLKTVGKIVSGELKELGASITEEFLSNTVASLARFTVDIVKTTAIVLLR